MLLFIILTCRCIKYENRSRLLDRNSGVEVQTSKTMLEEEHKVAPVILEDKWFFNREEIVDINNTFMLKQNSSFWKITLHAKVSVEFVPYLMPYKRIDGFLQACDMVKEMLLILFHAYLHRIVEANQLNEYVKLLDFETTKFFGAGIMKTFTEFGFSKTKIDDIDTEYDTNKVILHNLKYDRLLKENSDKLMEVMFSNHNGENIAKSLEKANLYFWPKEKEQKNALFVKSPERYKNEFEKQHPNISYDELQKRYVRYSEMHEYKIKYDITWTEKDYVTIFEDKKNETLEKLWNEQIMLEKYEGKQTATFATLWGSTFGLKQFEEKQEEQASTSTARLTPAKRKLDEDPAPGPTDHFSKLKKSYDSQHKTIKLPENPVFFTEYKSSEECFDDFIKTRRDMAERDDAGTELQYWGEIEISAKDTKTIKEMLKELQKIEGKGSLERTNIFDLNTKASKPLEILTKYLTNNMDYLNENNSTFVTSKIDVELIESFKPKHFVDESVLQKCVEFIYNEAKKYREIEFKCVFETFNIVFIKKQFTFEEYFILTCRYIKSMEELTAVEQIEAFRKESFRWCPVILPIASNDHIIFMVVFPVERSVFVFDSLGSLRVSDPFVKYEGMLMLLDFIYYGGVGKDWRISHEIPNSIQSANGCGICTFFGIRKILTGENYQVAAEEYNRYVLLKQYLKATKIEPYVGFFSDIGYEVADD